MKILALSYLYPNSQYPHYGIFVHNRLKAVSKYHEVKVINPIPWFPGCGRLSRYRNYNAIPAHEIIDGLEVFHPRFPIIPRFCKSLDALTYRAVVMPLAARLRQTYPFDLIDLHWTYPDLPTGTALKKKYGKKMVVTLRGKEAFHRGEGPIREALIRRHLLQADAVISLSRELQDMAVEVGVDAGRCSVIRNGVDTSRFYYMDMTECRQRLGIPLEEKVLLSVGSLNYGKGFDRLIRAMPAIIKENKKWKLYIIGSEGPAGNCRNELKALISEMKLESSVIFVGNVPNNDLVYWYNSADIFCLASRSEGSPNVLTEALASGCPVATTNVGSVVEILEKVYLEEFCFKNIGKEFCTGLQRTVTCHWNRQQISQDMKSYNWDWCGEKVVSVYEALIGDI